MMVVLIVLSSMIYCAVAGVVMRALAWRWKGEKLKPEGDIWVGACWAALAWPVTAPLLLGSIIHSRFQVPRRKPATLFDIASLASTKDYRHCKKLVEDFEKTIPVHER